MTLQPVRFCGALFSIIASGAVAAADDWTRFRGLDGAGVSNQQGLPSTWSSGSYAWNIELPGVGHSSPVVRDNDLFVTTAIDEGSERYLLCLNPATGDTRWSRRIGLNRSRKHNKSSWASATPALDEDSVYVAFADKEHHTLAAWDFEGTLRWRQNLGEFHSRHGQGASPIVFEELVILPNDQMGPSSVLAFDRRTGAVRWSVLRRMRETSYSTPIIVQPQNSPPQLICVSGGSGVSSLDPRTGTANWHTGTLPKRTVASPVYAQGLVFATCGQGGVGALMIAVDATGSGDVSRTHVRYQRERGLPYVPTPVAWRGHLYLWNDNGVVSCVRTASGETVWTRRVGGNYSGSPVCIDGRLYCISEEGDVVVIAASPRFEELGRNPLGDFSHSTPAVADGRLFLRTFHRLMCLATQHPQAG